MTYIYILMADDILQATWYSREFLYIRRFKVQYAMHCKVFKLQNQNMHLKYLLHWLFLQNFCFVMRTVQICIISKFVNIVNRMIYFFKGIHCTIHYVVFSFVVQSIENVFTVTQVDKERNVMAYMARSVNHPECPRKDDLVRVDIYCSYMVIKPKTTFSEVQPVDQCTNISASLLSFTNFCLFVKLYLRNNYERTIFLFS